MRLLPVLLAAFSVTGCYVDFGSSDRYQADFHYTYDLNPGGRITLSTFNGSVEVTGSDENKVEITGVKYASSEAMRDEIKIDTHNTPDTLDIRAVRPSGRFGNMGARFTLRVPRTARIDRIGTSNASIRVLNVARAEHLNTSNGSIRAENIAGGLDARTSNSSIDVDSVKGDLTMNTSNGRIHADGVEGHCEAGTSNSGITLTFRKPPSADVHAHSSNGGITVHLPAGSNARIDASTSNGPIRSDFDLTSGSNEKHHLDGSIGNGGPLLRLTTSNSGIHIERGGAD